MVFEHCIREVVERRRLEAWVREVRAIGQAIRCADLVFIRFNSYSLCKIVFIPINFRVVVYIISAICRG